MMRRVNESQKSKQHMRLTRRNRLKKRMNANLEIPRVSIYKSGKHFYAQLIDNKTGKSTNSLTTLSKEFKSQGVPASTVVGASKLGLLFGQILLKKDIKSIVFDRNGFKYHGRVKAFADSLRETGLKF